MTEHGGPETKTVGVPPKTFTIVTTAQVERTYVVRAKTEDQAKDRLHVFLKDPDSLAEGVVMVQPLKQVDTTPQRIKAKAETKQSSPA